MWSIDNNSPPIENIASGSTVASVTASRCSDDYRAIWYQWAENAPRGQREQRDSAARRLCDSLERFTDRLDLNDMNLSSLPEVLPEQIKTLNVCNNRLIALPPLPQNLHCLLSDNNFLTSLPESLPDSLIRINACNNLLAGIPDKLPASLEHFELVNNRIVGLHNNLPDNLKEISLAHNNLECLPDRLPAALQNVDLRSNKLRSLSQSIMRLAPQALIQVENNRFSALTLQKLSDDFNRPGYGGPRIDFSLEQAHVAIPPLHQLVQSWLPASPGSRAIAQWIAIEKESNAAAFSTFLNRLEQVTDRAESPEFQARMANWLNRLTEAPELRRATFVQASRCPEKVALTYNAMQNVVQTSDVERGLYDGMLPELIAKGREMFCLEQLRLAACEKVKTLDTVDEDSVYLAYQQGLRDPLALGTVPEKVHVSALTEIMPRELMLVQKQIAEKEAQAFPDWLAQWQPWQIALERTDTKFVNRLWLRQEYSFNDSYRLRMAAARLREGGSEEAVENSVRQDLEREYNIAFICESLLNHYKSQIAKESPRHMMDTVEDLTRIAGISPSLSAMLVRSEDAAGEHLGSWLAARISSGGMAYVAQKWIDLLYKLYRKNQLSDRNVISLLLPRQELDSVKSFAHAIVGTAWRSEAATRLCTLLSEVAASDNQMRQAIRERLAMKQPGYGFNLPELNGTADFYKRAKRADKLGENPAAKARLQESNLIPENRQLYQRACVTPFETSHREPFFSALKSRFYRD